MPSERPITVSFVKPEISPEPVLKILKLESSSLLSNGFLEKHVDKHARTHLHLKHPRAQFPATVQNGVLM